MLTDPADPFSARPAAPASAHKAASRSVEIDPSGSLDQAVLKLAAQAAFLQAFAENVVDEERSIEELAPRAGGGEIDFGWRAGLDW
jgi:hypothetical protein